LMAEKTRTPCRCGTILDLCFLMLELVLAVSVAIF